MKKIPSNIILVILGSAILTGCLPNPFFGSCANWNCTELNPRWLKKVRDCRSGNYQVILHELGDKLGYESTAQVQDSEIGRHASYQCTRRTGRYDIRKDKQYEHLFANLTSY